MSNRGGVTVIVLVVVALVVIALLLFGMFFWEI